MIDLVVSSAYSSYLLDVSIKASGLPAVILCVGKELIKLTAVAGVLLYAKKRFDGPRD